ncbi:hypothetical protein AC578_5986 [Pseudocercospora eumusae]|uniref:Uncharacterized protein n=1 Tax=Pseudocercospora eumusae TaxID=321146 RepID=A0A139GYL5_9PEZI|nr:hypothetical protein AC578_5986 [Pseudocercospora eumusae]
MLGSNNNKESVAESQLKRRMDRSETDQQTDNYLRKLARKQDHIRRSGSKSALKRQKAILTPFGRSSALGIQGRSGGNTLPTTQLFSSFPRTSAIFAHLVKVGASMIAQNTPANSFPDFFKPSTISSTTSCFL